MLKKFLLSIACLMLVFPAISFAAPLEISNETSAEASVNINVRTQPSIKAKRIGYFKKGEFVFVRKKIGEWCEVQYKTYRNAYVYCPLLKISKFDLSFDEVSFDYPSDWKTYDQGGIIGAYTSSEVTSQEGEKYSSSITVTKNVYKDAEEAATYVQGEGLGYGQNSRVVKLVKIPVGDKEYEATLVTYEVSFGAKDNYHNYKIQMMEVLKDNIIYMVYGEVVPKINPNFDQVEKIVKSFKVK